MNQIGGKSGIGGAGLVGIKAGLIVGAAAMTMFHAIARGPDGQIKWEDDFHNRVTTAGLNKLLDATFKTGLTTPAWYVGIAGVSITDAAITSGLAVLTSVSTPFTAADAGRAIIVRGAGASGADLVTTILSYTNSGSVTLAANAGTTVTGAAAIWECRAADTLASHSPWTEVSAYAGNRKAFTPGSIAAGSVDNSGSPASFAINANNTLVGGLFITDQVSGTSGILYGMGPFATSIRQLDSGDTLAVTATLTIAAT